MLHPLQFIVRCAALHLGRSNWLDLASVDADLLSGGVGEDFTADSEGDSWTHGIIARMTAVLFRYIRRCERRARKVGRKPLTQRGPDP